MSIESKIFNPQAKVLAHADRVLSYFDGNNVDPITLEIDPSNACNHSCPFCISGHIHLKKFKGTEFFNRSIMSREILLKFAKEICNTNIKSLSFTGGGEPTMNPALKETIEYIGTNSKIEMGMFSNGTNFERFNLFEAITRNLKWIRISLDAGKEETYDKIRITNNKNNFKTVISNINKLIKIKKDTKSNITIGVGFVVAKDNFDEILDFAKLFKNIDVDYCQYKPEIVQIERSGTRDLVKQQRSSDYWLNKVVDALHSAKDILGKKFECNSYKINDLLVDKKFYGRQYKECIGSQFQPCIGADGHVYVCTNHRGHKKYSYGNLYDNNFKKIWSNLSKRKEIMDNINKKEKFCNCTQLCKPHESNKMLWTIKQNLNNDDAIKDLKKKSKEIGDSIIHKNFI